MRQKNNKYDEPCYAVRWKSKSSGEIEHFGYSIHELALKMGYKKTDCSSIYKSAVKGGRGTGFYSIFKNEQEAQDFLKTGKQWPSAVKHIPTGNVWENKKQAQLWMHCSYDSMEHWLAKDGLGFVKTQEPPVIKDETLRYIRKYGESFFVWKGHDLEAEIEERRKKDIKLPNQYGTWDTEVRFEVNKVACLVKNCELIPSHKAGELLTILSVGDTGKHNYRVCFSNGDIGYLSEKEFKIL